jgi:hypothetical protein
MPQVTIRRPFGEPILGDHLRLEPHAVFSNRLSEWDLGGRQRAEVFGSHEEWRQ